MPKSGYFISYYTNETDVPVYFDNIVINHRSGPLLQESDTYAFGGGIDALESRSFGRAENKYGYNGKEKQPDLGLEWLDYGARMYDAQVGRWGVVDPLSDEAFCHTPYSYAFNNPVIFIDPNGMFADYYTVAGEYLGTDGINDHRVYVTTKDAWNLNFQRASDLSWDYKMFAQMLQSNSSTKYLPISQYEFQTSSNIVKQEGVSNNPDEYLWIAHATNNSAKGDKISFFKKIMSGFSSVAKNDKVPLSNTNNVKNNMARAAMISVLSGIADPTGGASLWDGTDLLAWGLKSPNGTPHNKFEEYKSMNISSTIFYTFLNNNKSKYGEKVKYNGIFYSIPAEVFTKQSNWPSGSNFEYNTGAASNYGLEATGAFGLSIFWKKF